MSDPSEEPKPKAKGGRRRIWATTGLTLGAIATLGAAGATWWLWVFVNERLSPWASELLTESLERPVVLGEVERVSLTGLRFGPSAMPATETDPDELFVAAIDVRFNPLQLLRRTVNPQITLTEVQAYIAQNEDGQWVDVDLDLDDDDDDDDRDPLIQVNPTVAIAASEVVLLPYLGEGETPLPLTVGNINGAVTVTKVEVSNPTDEETTLEAQEIALDLSAEPEAAGTLNIDGIIRQLDYGDDAPDNVLDSLEAQLVLRVQALDLAALAPVVVASVPQGIPLTVTAGILNGNVEAELAPQAEPRLTGTARLQDGEFFVGELATPFTAVNTQARFQGDRVAFDTTTARYGALTAQARGTIDPRNGYDLTGAIAPVALTDLAETFEFDPPVTVAGTVKADNVTITGPLAEPVVTGQIVSTDTVTIDQVPLERLATQIIYRRTGLEFADIDVRPAAGGSLTGAGTFAFGQPAQLALQLVGRDLPADALARPYGLPETYEIGAIALDADIAGPLNNLQGVVSWDAPAGTYPTRGTAEVAANTVRVRNAELAGGTVSGVGTLVADQWTADVVAQGLQLGVFNADLQGIVGGGDVQLAGSTADFSLQGIRGNGAITAALRGGTLTSQVALANGNWEADIQTRAFPVRQFAPNLPIDTVNADARLAGTVADFSLASLRGDGTVDAAIASGTVTSDFTLANGTWQANGQGSNLQLGQLSPDLQGVGEATFQLAGNLDNLTPAGIQGRANVRLSDGLATLAAVNSALGRMRSPLTSRLAWDGQQLQIEQLETAGLFASGTVTPLLSGPTAPGIAAIDLGITADNYALASLPLSLPPVLGLAGEADFRGRLTGTPNNLNFAGDLALANLALNDLVFDPLLTGAVDFSSEAGLTVALLGPPVTMGQRDEITVEFQPQPRQLDFTVRAGEAISTGTTEGDLLIATLEQFPISVLNLPPSDSPYGSLRGQVTSANATINLTNLNTVGRFDVANLGIGYYSVAGLSGGFAYAGGTARLTEGQIVMVDRNARGEAIGDRRLYDLSGRYSFNQMPQLQATLATDQGELRDIFEVLKIRELADLRRGFTPNDGFIPDSEAEAETILATTPAGDPNGTLLNQLRRLSEIAELDIQEELATEQATLPPLSELQGAFQGEVEVTATLPRDLQVAFDLTGQGWEWGADLQADTVVAQGTYDNGLVSLAPLQFSAQAPAPTDTPATDTPATNAPATLSFVGDFSLNPADQTDYLMTIQAVNVPISKVENIANLPFTAGGRLNSTARLRGKLSDPNLTGDLQVIDGSLNGSPIEAASATFSYAEARAGLDAQLLLLGSDDPLTLSAEGPYQLPFVTTPASDLTYRLNANVRDEGFALLNLFTRQIAWESGEGEIILNLEGDLANTNTLFTQFDGLIFLRGATISARALPVPMTDVTGQIRLVPTNPAIVVERLTGRFSEGELSAQGAFPLFVPLSTRASESAADPDPEAENSTADPDPLPPPGDVATLSTVPLTLDLSNIALQLQGLYSGQVNGRMQLGGSVVLGPALSGAIDLSNGTITIPERANGAAAAPAAASRSNGRFIQPFRFADLRILLGRSINIVQGNLLNVTARGGLRIDGTLDNLQPTGTIQLPSGRVGLYSVALRLAGRNDRAEFRGDFDPLLDVTLQTALPDVASAAAGIEQSTGPFPRNEVVDSALNVIGLTQQGNSLVRINARYTGPASELANLTTDSRNLELSSSPPRSNQEIISLLSGNVIGALGALEDGDSAIAGLGTFLGSALLSSVRDFLGDTVPISEFRLFQVSESSGGVNDSEDIGGEIGFDITSNISVSVLKVLTNDTPFQFNTRYRLSDEFTLRGTTSYEDFSDRTGVLLEYETRF